MAQITELLAEQNLLLIFLNKLKIVEEELDETMFFLELLGEFNPTEKETIQKQWKEGNELLSIVVASIITIRKNDQNRKSS